MITISGRVALVRDPRLAVEAGVMHGFAERGGGVSEGPYASLNLGPRSGDDRERVVENRRRLLAAAGVAGLRVVGPRQVHSAEVTALAAAEPLPEGGVVAGDAVLTDRLNLALLILAADCVPILLSDRECGVIGAVHAGWRGTAGGIVAVAVATMAARFGSRPAAIVAALGPAISRCCYEVGPEVLAAVAARTPLPPAALYDRLPGGKGRLDLIAANTAQLIAAGVPPARIGAGGGCTACEPARFFSHRRDGEPSGRGGAVIARVGLGPRASDSSAAISIDDLSGDRPLR